MELTFTNNTAEFRAETHFNLHIEGGGNTAVYRKTSGNKWDLLGSRSMGVFDEDVVVTFPAEFRVETTSVPSVAVVTFNE